jgi:hypothetical protein
VDPARQRVERLRSEIAGFQAVAANADAAERNTAALITAAEGRVAAAREGEGRTLEAWQVKQLMERRDREREFRLGVAALREDPDTYGPGDPNSDDPVLQTSISVIGEGLIQLRGPVKGLNTIRIMINQIDAPVGQVRIGVHTLQVNGERGDRMERVVANIQRHMDHSRFLTAQSAQYLRKAVILVASRRAEQVAAELGPNCTQEARDQKYLYAFFGKDFTDELITLDSEFLKTGNKLLGLHSMDSTSLAAALFVMSLAKNEVRGEIIREFVCMLQRDLPQAEANYYLAGLVPTNYKCDAATDRKFYMLSNNARFQSFLGFFNAEVNGNETLNPAQREFIRLAQIFKARLITEIQLRQRIFERTLLEERIGPSYRTKLEEARVAEEDAKRAVRDAQGITEEAQLAVVTQFQLLFGSLAEVDETLGALIIPELTDYFRLVKEEAVNPMNPMLKNVPVTKAVGNLKRQELAKFNVMTGKFELTENGMKDLIPRGDAILKLLANFVFQPGNGQAEVKDVTTFVAKIKSAEPSFTLDEIVEADRAVKAVRKIAIEAVTRYRNETNRIVTQLQSSDDAQVRAAIDNFENLKALLRSSIQPGANLPGVRNGLAALNLIDAKILDLTKANFRRATAVKRAKEARQPLDEKKLLDMLVDEMEDKFIELLEGTRAHTANVDNYLKSVATALDDDFNTQFYNPSFRRAREASRYWDVTLAQIETTNILANNRAFAKVAPAATFEFDLPKRSILLKEGFASAKALIDEYGALMTDPSFLALAKMSSGNPVSMMSGGGGLSSVRNVLPGLPSSSDEMLMAQAGGGQPQKFGSALDNLIPDPAIYKLETGTGFEIRPVLSPDGQAVVFNFNYMYTTNVREPVRADEKHLGRVDRHFINTDVQLSNYELREVSKYQVAAKIARTGKGVPLLQDVPGIGRLFRPLPSAESSLQQNLIYAQSTIFPTLFDLMGLRYAQAVADLDPMADRLGEFAARVRRLDVEQRIYDITAARVDEAIRTPFGERRTDTYRPQITLPHEHPNGFIGPGLRQRDGVLQEGFDPFLSYPPTRYTPGFTEEGRMKQLPGYTGQRGPGYETYPTHGGPIPHGVPFESHLQRNPAPSMTPPPRGVANVPPGISGPSGYSQPPGGTTAVREMPNRSLPPVVTPSPVPGTPVSRPGGTGTLPNPARPACAGGAGGSPAPPARAVAFGTTSLRTRADGAGDEERHAAARRNRERCHDTEGRRVRAVGGRGGVRVGEGGTAAAHGTPVRTPRHRVSRLQDGVRRAEPDGHAAEPDEIGDGPRPDLDPDAGPRRRRNDGRGPPHRPATAAVHHARPEDAGGPLLPDPRRGRAPPGRGVPDQLPGGPEPDAEQRPPVAAAGRGRADHDDPDVAPVAEQVRGDGAGVRVVPGPAGAAGSGHHPAGAGRNPAHAVLGAEGRAAQRAGERNVGSRPAVPRRDRPGRSRVHVQVTHGGGRHGEARNRVVGGVRPGHGGGAPRQRGAPRRRPRPAGAGNRSPRPERRSDREAGGRRAVAPERRADGRRHPRDGPRPPVLLHRGPVVPGTAVPGRAGDRGGDAPEDGRAGVRAGDAAARRAAGELHAVHDPVRLRPAVGDAGVRPVRGPEGPLLAGDGHRRALQELDGRGGGAGAGTGRADGRAERDSAGPGEHEGGGRGGRRPGERHRPRDRAADHEGGGGAAGGGVAEEFAGNPGGAGAGAAPAVDRTEGRGPVERVHPPRAVTTRGARTDIGPALR